MGGTYDTLTRETPVYRHFQVIEPVIAVLVHLHLCRATQRQSAFQNHHGAVDDELSVCISGQARRGNGEELVDALSRKKASSLSSPLLPSPPFDIGAEGAENEARLYFSTCVLRSHRF